MTILILLTEICLGSWWCYEYKRHNKFPLLKMFFLMEKEPFYDEEWIGLQVRVSKRSMILFPNALRKIFCRKTVVALMMSWTTCEWTK